MKHPARAFNEFDSPAINDSRAKHNRDHRGAFARFKQVSFGLKAGAEVNHVGGCVQLSNRWPIRSCFSFDMRKTDEHELVNTRISSGLYQILYVPHIGFPQKSVRQRRE